MLKAPDDIVMEQEDSASQNGETTSWDINDVKLPQVRVRFRKSFIYKFIQLWSF